MRWEKKYGPHKIYLDLIQLVNSKGWGVINDCLYDKISGCSVRVLKKGVINVMIKGKSVIRITQENNRKYLKLVKIINIKIASVIRQSKKLNNPLLL